MIKVLKAGKELSDWKAKNTPERCTLCGRPMKSVVSRNQVVDHDHATGEIRTVMCRNCNSLEGKVRNLCVRSGNWISNVDFLKNLIDHWTIDYRTGVYYPGTTVVNGKAVPKKKKRKRRVTK